VFRFANSVRVAAVMTVACVRLLVGRLVDDSRLGGAGCTNYSRRALWVIRLSRVTAATTSPNGGLNDVCRELCQKLSATGRSASPRSSTCRQAKRHRSAVPGSWTAGFDTDGAFGITDARLPAA